MLLVGTLFMGFWLFLVGGLQGAFGQWGVVDGARMLRNKPRMFRPFTLFP
jgi:hypothetical protein